jgi:copper homeostasis protein
MEAREQPTPEGGSGRGVILEVCVESAEGAAAARRGGADRVELCCALCEGGLTPSAGALALARETGVELVILVRPRPGDFLYSADEYDVLRRDVLYAREAGAAGVALGILRAGGEVDVERTAELVELARPLQVTFHRAFDAAREPRRVLEELIAAGTDRVLTSGGARSAPEGSRRIRELVEQAAGRIAIVAAGGIREHNARRLVEETGVREVHFSAGTLAASAMRFRNSELSLRAGSLPAEDRWLKTDPARVERVAAALRRG